MVERLFLAVPWGCLRFVIVVFPDHTYLLFWKKNGKQFVMVNPIEITAKFAKNLERKRTTLICVTRRIIWTDSTSEQQFDNMSFRFGL